MRLTPLWLLCLVVSALLAVGAHVLTGDAQSSSSKGGGGIVPLMVEYPVKRDCDDCPEMIGLAAGQVTMSSYRANEAMQKREILVPSFLLAKYETTRADWARCVKDRACSVQPLKRDGFEDLPVVGISWQDAQGYAAWLRKKTGLSYRLPSEAEWEYAARSGSRGRFFWGDDELEACEFGNVADAIYRQKHVFSPAESCADGYAEAAPVGRFMPNRWGFMDIFGNASEYVADDWTDDLRHKPQDGQAYVTGSALKTIKDGYWQNNATSSEPARRWAVPASERQSVSTVRVARD